MSNSAPTITLPGVLDFGVNSLNNTISGLSVSDADDDILTVTLSAEGLLSLGTLTGLSFTVGDGTEDNTMTFSGSVADINAALATLSYTPALDDMDGDTLNIVVSDGETFITTPGTFASSLNLSDLDGDNGFVIHGVDIDDFSGWSVSCAGDVNGDGVDDVLIGASGGDPNGIESGETYVVFGGNQAASSGALELSSLNGSNGFVINGINAEDFSGQSVSTAGDVNGDGIDDVLIGARHADPNGNSSAGETYVVFGGAATGSSGVLELSSLNGSDGFIINGIYPGDQSGYSVSSAGDVNGDGVDDFLVSAPLADPNGSNSGVAYVVFGGTATGSSGALDLSDLNGANGFVINGIDIYDRLGNSVSSAGDVNGDGVDDLLIGADRADPDGNFNAGETYVVFGGTATGSSGALELSSLNGTNGYIINGIDAYDYSGWSVSSAGDVNGDGVDDLLIGAPSADPNGHQARGETYVVFGGSATESSGALDLSDLNGNNGFVINGVDDGDRSGYTVSSAGDINGDGVDDLLIGAPYADPNGNTDVGETYVVYGSADIAEQFSTASVSISLSSDDPTLTVPADFTFGDNTSGNDASGISVADTDDTSLIVSLSVADGALTFDVIDGLTFSTGDGTDDQTMVFSGDIADLNFALTTLLYTPANGDTDGDTLEVGVSDGHTLIVTTGDYPANFDLSSLDGTNGFALHGETAGDRLGFDVANAGDFNGDGIDDFLVSAPNSTPAGTDSGLTYLVYGTTAGFSADFDVSSLAAADGFRIAGESANDFSGSSISSAGDVNGDGYDDVLIGAYQNDESGSDAGATYLVYGTSNTYSSTYQLSDLNGTTGVKLTGLNAGDQFGYSVSAAGDFNGDGFDDVLVGAPLGERNSGNNNGESYILFGSASGIPTSLSGFPAGTGIYIRGDDVDDQSGYDVSGIGDINGDGYDDVLVGAIYGDPNGSSSGESYVIFGTSAPSNNIELSSLNGSNGFVLNGKAGGDRSGLEVSGAGDFNGDGLDDLLIDASFSDPNGSGSGEVYVVFGSTAGFGSALELSALNGTNGFTVNGATSGDKLGEAISSAGDLNADGYDDIIIGAHNADGAGNSRGEAFVIFGSSSGFSATLEVTDLNGENGFAISGIADGDRLGFSVSAAGDVNGDGFDDLMVGGYLADPDGLSGAGSAYIIYGTQTFEPVFYTETVSIGLVNLPPIPVDDDLDVLEDATVSGNLLTTGTYDSDPNGDTFSITAINGSAFTNDVAFALASGGLLTINADGTFTYDPNGQFEHLSIGDIVQDTFTYTLTDEHGESADATVTLNILGLNDAATIGGDVTGTINENLPDPFEIYGQLTSTDIDNDDNSFFPASYGTTLGVLNVAANGQWSYQQDADAAAVDSLDTGDTLTDVITITSEDGTEQDVTITIVGENDTPTTPDFAVGATVGASGSIISEAINFFDYLSDPEDGGHCDPVTGMYVPDPDGQMITVSWTLISGDDLEGAEFGDGNPCTLDLGFFSDDYVSLGVGETQVSIYEWTASDGPADGSSIYSTSTGTFTYTITGVNDGPTANNDEGATGSVTAFTTGNVLANDTDPDTNDVLSVLSIDTTGTLGSVTNNGDGTFTYDPSEAF